MLLLRPSGRCTFRFGVRARSSVGRGSTSMQPGPPRARKVAFMGVETQPPSRRYDPYGGGVSPDSRDDNREDIREFLATRRARLTPADVGLPTGSRRRVPGLRREEVAVLAGVSTEW